LFLTTDEMPQAPQTKVVSSAEPMTFPRWKFGLWMARDRPLPSNGSGATANWLQLALRQKFMSSPKLGGGNRRRLPTEDFFDTHCTSSIRSWMGQAQLRKEKVGRFAANRNYLINILGKGWPDRVPLFRCVDLRLSRGDRPPEDAAQAARPRRDSA
jgi:hypothetical protein